MILETCPAHQFGAPVHLRESRDDPGHPPEVVGGGRRSRRVARLRGSAPAIAVTDPARCAVEGLPRRQLEHHLPALPARRRGCPRVLRARGDFRAGGTQMVDLDIKAVGAPKRCSREPLFACGAGTRWRACDGWFSYWVQVARFARVEVARATGWAGLVPPACGHLISAWTAEIHEAVR